MENKGKLIIRGRDWKWQDQDGGAGNVGKVVTDNRSTARIQWPTGHSNVYRTGAESGKFDLLTVDSSGTGLIHEGVYCDACPGQFEDKGHIHGTRWKCAVCDDFDLCTKCYMKGEHSKSHNFRRCDSMYSLGSFLTPRENARTLKIICDDLPYDTVFLDHLEKLGSPQKVHIVRGPDWRWSDQDQGEGNVGLISEKRNKLSRPQWLAVAWLPHKEEKNIYRAGAEHKKDLRLLDSRQIGSEHLDHMCSVCEETPIKGIRWQCMDCPSPVQLCSNCYMDNQHNLTHKFLRFAAQVGKGSKCPPREGGRSITLRNKPAWYTAKSYYVDHLPTVSLWENMVVFGNKKVVRRRALREDPQAVPEMSESNGKITIGTFVVLNTVTDKIGQGQFGTVYRGYGCVEKRPVAVKEIRVPTDMQKQLAMAEIKHLQAFQKHEHMVSLMKYGFFNEAFWIVMEYCNMGDLQGYTRTYKPDEPTRIQFMVQMASAVDFIHRMSTPMIHRDLKPANILLTFDDSESPVIKVADFGLSKIIHGADAVKTAMLTATSKAGTPYYMAPEVWAQEARITAAVDVFSLALLFYGCLEAQRNDWDLYPDLLAEQQSFGMAGLGQRLLVPVPLDMDRVIMKHSTDSEPVQQLKTLITRMLATDRDQRPKAKEVFEEMQGVFAGMIDEMGPPPPKPTIAIPDLPAYEPPTEKIPVTDDDDSDSEDSEPEVEADDGGGLGYQLLRSAMAAGLREELGRSGLGAALEPEVLEKLVKEMPLLEALMKGARGTDKRGDRPMEVGDSVKVDTDAGRVKRLQESFGGFVESMTPHLGDVGVIDEVILHIVSVKFNTGHSYRFNPECLSHVDKAEVARAASGAALERMRHAASKAQIVGSLFHRFDVVKICDEPSVLEMLQQGHGGWSDSMKICCGLRGLVNRIDSEGDVYVECINGFDWWINPEALIKIESTADEEVEAGDLVLVSGDIEEVKAFQKGHGEWCSDMAKALGHTGMVKQALSGDRARVEVRNFKWIFNSKLLKVIAKSDMLVGLVKRRVDGRGVEE